MSTEGIFFICVAAAIITIAVCTTIYQVKDLEYTKGVRTCTNKN